MTIYLNDQSYQVEKSHSAKDFFQSHLSSRFELHDLRLLCDGERICFTDDDAISSIIDGDSHVHSFYPTVGGNVDGDDEDAGNAPITLKVRDQTQEEMMFKVKKGTKMSKIFSAYAQRKGVDMKQLRFTYDGNRVTADDTPKMLEMEDGDQIDSYIEQLGGGDIEVDDAPITLKVKDQSGEEMMFKVKKGTKMSKIFGAYAQRKGVDMANLRFTLDGARVQGEDTPKMLEMEDGDQLESLMEQQGGGDSEDAAETPITLKVRDQSGDEMMFKVKKGTKMSKIFTAYAQRKGLDSGNLRFQYDGERINDDDTPKMLEMEDGDQIDTTIEQVGGQ